MRKQSKFRNKNVTVFSNSLRFIVCCLLLFIHLVLSQIQKLHLENYCFRLNNCFSERPKQGKLLLEKYMHSLHNSLILASRFTPDPESQKSNSDREGQQTCSYSIGLERKALETESRINVETCYVLIFQLADDFY